MSNPSLDKIIDKATEADPDDRHAIEEKVIATVWKNGIAAGDLWKAFVAAEWAKPLHKEISKALQELRNPKAEPLVVEAFLKDSGFSLLESDRRRLRFILSELTAIEPGEAVFLLNRMREADNKQAIINLLSKAMTTANKGDNDGALSIVLKGLQAKKIVQEYETEDKAVIGLLERLIERKNNDREYIGLDSGLTHLNTFFNGLPAGLFVLAGAPSTGKTTLAKQIADYVAKKEKTPVLFWSFEQPKEDLQIKSFARMASINSREIYNGTMEKEDWNRVVKANKDYIEGAGRYLTIIEANRKDNLDRIRTTAQMAQYKAGGKPILIIIDYLQLIPALPDAPDNKREQIDMNLTELRRLARDLNSPVLVLSSMNRKSIDNDKDPALTSLKESGGIEYSADGVLILQKEKENKALSKDVRRETLVVECFILKNRNGGLGRIILHFTPSWSLFTEERIEPL